MAIPARGKMVDASIAVVPRTLAAESSALPGRLCRLVDQRPRAPCSNPGPVGQARRACSLAAAMIVSGRNPYLCCSSFKGAEAPKVRMPMIWPASPA